MIRIETAAFAFPYLRNSESTPGLSNPEFEVVLLWIISTGHNAHSLA
jgi:hypothetical protein